MSDFYRTMLDKAQQSAPTGAAPVSTSDNPSGDALAVRARAMENDPDFQDLPYSDQLALRGQMFERIRQEDPDVAGMDSNTLHDFAKAYVVAAPSLKDKTIEQNLKGLFEGYKAIPAELKDRYYKKQITEEERNKNPQVQQLAMMDYLYKNYNDSNAGGLLTSIGSKVGIYLNQLEGEKGPQDNPMRLGIGSGDESKIWEYLNAQIQTGEYTPSGLTKDIVSVGNFANQMLDYAAIGATTKLFNAAGNVVKGTGNALKIAQSSVLNQVWRSTLLPLLTDAAVGGAVGAVIEGAISRVNSTPDRDPFTNMEKMVMSVGFGAAMDLGFGMFGRSVSEGLFSGIKHTFNGKKINNILKTGAANADELAINMEHNIVGSTVAPEIRAQFSEFQQAFLQHRDYLNSMAGKKAKDFDEVDRLFFGVTAADPNGFAIHPQADGSFKMFELDPVLQDVKYYRAPDIVAAYDVMAERLRTKMMDADWVNNNPISVNLIQKYAPWVQNWTLSGRAVNLNVEVGVRSVDGSITDKRIELVDRPFIGENELAAAKPALAIPIRADVDIVDKMKQGQTMMGYSDLRVFQSDPANRNMVMLAENPKELPVEMFNNMPNVSDIVAFRQAGHDALILKNQDGSIAGYVPLVTNNIKLPISHVDLATGKPTQQLLRQKFGRASKGSIEARLHETIGNNISLKELGGNTQQLIEFAAARFSKTVDPADVSLFTRALTGQTGDKIFVRQTKTPDQIAPNTYVSVVQTERGIEIDMPGTLTSALHSKNFTQALAYELENLSVAKGETNVRASYVMQILSNKIAARTSAFDKIFNSSNKQLNLYSRDTLDYALKNELGTNLIDMGNGTYRAKINNEWVTGSLGDVYKKARPWLVPMSSLLDQFAQNGAKVRRMKDGTVVIKELDGKIFHYNSLPEAAQSHGLNTEILPSKYRPMFVELDSSSNAVNITEERAIRMGKADVIEFLNGFSQTDTINKAEVAKAGLNPVSINTRTMAVELIDKKTKTKVYFATAEEAKRFAQNKLESFEGVEQLARSKGIKINKFEGQYEVYPQEAGSIALKVKTLGEVKEILAKYDTQNLDADELIPDGDAMLAQMPADIVQQWKTFRPDFQPYRSDLMVSLDNFNPSGKAAVSQWFENMFDTFEGAFAHSQRMGNISEAVARTKSQLINAKRAESIAVTEYRHLMRDIFTVDQYGNRMSDIKGKPQLLARESRERIAEHLGAEDRSVLEKLSPTEETIYNDLRTLLGKQAPHTRLTSGLAQRFGINFDRFTPQYMHRAKLLLSSDPEAEAILRKMTTPAEAFKFLESKGVEPSKLQEMKLDFEHSRVSDIHQAIFEKDALAIMLRYGETGIRKIYLDIPAREFDAALQAQPMPTQTALLLTNFQQQLLKPYETTSALMGLQQGAQAITTKLSEVLTKMSSSKFGKAAGLDRLTPMFASEDFKLSGRNLLDNFILFTNSSLMGLRPVTALRNVAQVYTMFGPAYGMDNLASALKLFNGKDDQLVENLVRRLRSSGTLSPSQTFLGEVLNETKLQKYANVAFKMFRNADEYTRCISYMAATSKFAQTLKKMQQIEFVSDDARKAFFINDSKLSMFQHTEPYMIDDMWKAINSPTANLKVSAIDAEKLMFGNAELAQAAHTYADHATEFTLFNYSQWNKPMLFKQNSIVGKIAGQLGMFGASYRHYLGTIITNLDPVEKAVFLGNFIATNLAFAAAFQVAQIRTNDFVPFLPGLTGFGPSFEMVVNAAKAATDLTQQGDSARRELNQQWSPLGLKKVPVNTGSLEIAGLDPATQGQEWRLQYPTMLPGGMHAFYVGKATEYWQRGDFYRAALSYSASAAEGDWQDDWTLVRGVDLTSIPQANPTTFVRTEAQKKSELGIPSLPGLPQQLKQ